MTILLFSFLTGAVLGAVFTLLKLPLPAPAALAGVLGVVGIYVGMVIVDWLRS